MNCDELQQLAALHALGALEGPERELLEARLRSDPEARADFARFAVAAAALAYGLEQREAPKAARARVLARIAQTPQLRATGEPVPSAGSAEPLPAGISIVRGTEERGCLRLFQEERSSFSQ